MELDAAARLKLTQELWAKHKNEVVEMYMSPARLKGFDLIINEPEKVAALPPYSSPFDQRELWWFLHHEEPLEMTHDVQERVTYVKEDKDLHELDVRLRAMKPVKNFDALPEQVKIAFLKANQHAIYAYRISDIAVLNEHGNAIYADSVTDLNARTEALRQQIRAAYIAEYPENAELITEMLRLNFPDYDAWYDANPDVTRADFADRVVG